jgi:hypothetical protein
MPLRLLDGRVDGREPRMVRGDFLVERRGFEPMAIGPWLRPIWSSSLVKRSDWPSPA